MDYKEMYNILQDMEYADKVKDSIEDLYLFLNEIENMIHTNNNTVNYNDNHDEFRYKLQIIEKQITEIDNMLKENDENNNEYNECNEYLS